MNVSLFYLTYSVICDIISVATRERGTTKNKNVSRFPCSTKQDGVKRTLSEWRAKMSIENYVTELAEGAIYYAKTWSKYHDQTILYIVEKVERLEDNSVCFYGVRCVQDDDFPHSWKFVSERCAFEPKLAGFTLLECDPDGNPYDKRITNFDIVQTMRYIRQVPRMILSERTNEFGAPLFQISAPIEQDELYWLYLFHIKYTRFVSSSYFNVVIRNGMKEFWDCKLGGSLFCKAYVGAPDVMVALNRLGTLQNSLA